MKNEVMLVKYSEPRLHPINRDNKTSYASCDPGSYNYDGGCVSGGTAGNTCSTGGNPFSTGLGEPAQ